MSLIYFIWWHSFILVCNSLNLSKLLWHMSCPKFPPLYERELENRLGRMSRQGAFCTPDRQCGTHVRREIISCHVVGWRLLLPLVLTSPSWCEHTVEPAATGRRPELAHASALNSHNWTSAKTQCPAKNTNCNYLKNRSSFVGPFLFSQREGPC